MTVPTVRQRPMSVAMLAAFAAAIWLRVAVGGAAVTGSGAAGLAFAGSLLAFTLAGGTRVRLDARVAAVGSIGGVLLCLPRLAGRLAGGPEHRPAGSYLAWATVVTVVAVAEELFLRGALFDAVSAWRGDLLAVGAGAVAFALLHLPLYGWQVLPLDLAVGTWLGALRVCSGSPGAPAIAHTVADLAAWWLR